MAQGNPNEWTAFNVDSTFQPPEDFHDYFSLTSPPDRKIWRLVRSRDEITAPMILKRLELPFVIAEVTVFVPLDLEWDQAGIVLFLDMSPTEPWISPSSLEGRRRGRTVQHTGKWVTVALQLSDSDVGIGVVVSSSNAGPDFSFTAIQIEDKDHLGHVQGAHSLRIKLENVNNMLWIYYMIPDTHRHTHQSVEEVAMQWKKVREINGFFNEVDTKSSVLVGCYASRPLDLEEEDRRDLVAEFEDLELLERA